jgi:penicillin amidase
MKPLPATHTRASRAQALSIFALTQLLGCPGRNNPQDASSDAAAALDIASDMGAGSDVEQADTGEPTDAPNVQYACTRPARRAPIADLPQRAAIEVVRDDLGIPHIFAQNDADALFGAGYTQAVDRLFQMELLRRTAYGTTAEVQGADKLSQDRLLRVMNIGGLGQITADRVAREAPNTYRMVHAWVSGVNRRIGEIQRGEVPLPPGFRASELNFMPTRWSPDDAFAVSRLLLFRNAGQLEYDILASVVNRYVDAAANIPFTKPARDTFVLPPEERPAPVGMRAERAPERPNPLADPARRSRLPVMDPALLRARFAEFSHTMEAIRSGGSNNWAVDGRFTDNGRPYIAGDPHQSLQAPSVFWAHHMNSADRGGSVDVIGFGFAGTPGVQLGHNRRVGWTATTTYPDMMDMFDVPLNSATSSILLGAMSYPVQRCVEHINVRDAAGEDFIVEDVSGQGVLLPTNISPLPITAGGRNRILFRWTGFKATIDADVFFAFDTSQSVADFERAVDRMENGAFNFVFADQNNIAYRVHVDLPDRGNPAEIPGAPNRILPGSNPRAVWPMDRFAPLSAFPHSRGGTRGFLASANNDPFGFTANGRIDDDPWYYGSWFDPGTRATRIEQELTRLTNRASMGGARVTRRDMQDIQLDTHSIFADEMLPHLFTSFSRVDTDPSLAEFRNDPVLPSLVQLLRDWDRRMDRDSSAAVVYEGWQNFLTRRVLADDLSVVFDPIYGADVTYTLKLLQFVLNGSFTMSEELLQEGRNRTIVLALRDTKQWLISRFGSADPSSYHWRDFHRTKFGSLLGAPGIFEGGTAVTNGSTGTVNVSAGAFLESGQLTARMFHQSGGGACYRMVIGFAADGTPEATLNFAPGNSGDPSSPHWRDQVNNWTEGVYQPLYFTRAAVMSHAIEQRTLMP